MKASGLPRAAAAALLAGSLAVAALGFAALRLGAIGLGVPGSDGPHAAQALASGRRSGFETMAPELRAMQMDDTSNPGMLWVAEGERLWHEPPAAGKPACAGCHGAAEAGMRAVAARFPALDARTKRPVDLAGRVNLCRTGKQTAPALAPESDELLALTAYVAHQSRGMPISPPDDPVLASFRAAGKTLYRRRIGQLDLSCAECHDRLAGARLGGNLVPQAHPTGYPLYRLEWQTLGSLERRIRNCMIGVRAEPYTFGAEELVALELYLMSRAAGMTLETPAVRP